MCLSGPGGRVETEGVNHVSAAYTLAFAKLAAHVGHIL